MRGSCGCRRSAERALRSLARAAPVWVALVWLAGAPLGPALAAEEGCESCHDDVHVATEPHGELGCTTCHGEVDAATHDSEPEQAAATDEVCSDCHEAAEGIAGSVHDALSCTDCHGPPHEIRPVSDLASPLSPVKQLQTCGTCHDSPPELVEGLLASVHARALLLSGLINAPSCSDCHGGHEILEASDPHAPTARESVPETCGSCHALLLDAWERDSAHGRAWREGLPEAPVCTTCHASHRVEDPTQGEARFKIPERCGSCHGERISSYRDGFHGKVTDLGFLEAATCSDCHTPHTNVAASDPRSSVHPDRLPETCGRCHGEVNAAFASFDPHPDPSDRDRQPAVYWTWVLMTGLLLGVFGLFTIHGSLWLQRSLVGVLRGEFEGMRSSEGPYVRRFSRAEVWLHVTVVVTFLLLATTGLPLKFHESGWARNLNRVLGGVAVTGALHRLAALVTFGYFGFHLLQLAGRLVSKRDWRMFWGPDSLVPRPQDLVDLFRNLRYFLYLGERPRLDRWTYWEKFDYFAVFWGVALIGASGLMLWFPGFTTQFLPGWVLNVAFVIHSDEALLAVGFIFVFHFFHTHVRPESFPLDPVIFVDRMPLQRFREERPLEYERLKDTGELERRLVAPPTPGQLRAARVFGFSALAIGMALAVAILWSSLVHGPPV